MSFRMPLLILVLVFPPGRLAAQTAEVLEESSGGVRPRPSISTMEIHKTLLEPFEAKELGEAEAGTPLNTILPRFQKMFTDRKLPIEWVIDRQAFLEDDKETPALEETSVRFPAFPRRMALTTALRIALDQVPTKNATFWVRRGQIVITTVKRSLSMADDPIRGLDLKNRPLAEALDEVAELSGVSIILDSRVGAKARTPITAKVAFIRPRTAALLFADQAGLEVVPMRNVLYVTTPKNAARLKSDPPEREFDGRRPIRNVRFFVGEEAGAIMEELGLRDFLVDGRVSEQMKSKITAKFNLPVEADTALRLVADMAGLGVVWVGGVRYVTSATNARKMRAAQKDDD